MRRAFELPEEDMTFLEGLDLEWELIIESNVKWLLIKQYPIVSGYNHKFVDVALRIEAGYPDRQIDMAYYNPSLSRLDSKPINKITIQNIDGMPWQRWSRHRGNTSRWRAGVDCVETHLAYMEHWMREELLK